MARCEESKIEFDFDVARQVHTHDMKCQCVGNYRRDDNSLWPGIDFRIEDAAGWLWLEVKNWRISARNSYSRKMQSEAFAREMREKFLGTAAFLASRKDPDALPRPLTLVFLFQPPHGADPGLRGIGYELIRNQIHTALTPLNISLAVVDVSIWNQRFPDYPAKQI
jgi:hypothetical protein